MFLGLDLSLTATGIAVTSGPETKSFTAAPKDLKGPARLDWFDGEIRRIVQQYGVTGVAVEGYAFGAQSQSHKLGELGGVVRLALWRLGVPYVLVPPTTLKKFATGKGGGDKGVVMVAVYKRWGLEPKDNNQADAIVLAKIAEAQFGTPHDSLTTFQAEAMTAVELVAPRVLPVRLRTRPAR